MDQATLVDLNLSLATKSLGALDVDAGTRILAALDTASLKVSIALWLLSEEHESWRLVFASPDFNQTSRLKAYEQIAAAIQRLEPYVLPLMYVLPMKDPFVKELRRLFGKVKSVEGMRLGGQTIGGRYIEDAYVYRVR